MNYLSLILLAWLNLGTIALAENHQYPPEFVQTYNQECIQTAMEEGLEQMEANRLCDCTINEFSQQYTVEEFKQLTADSATDKQAEASLIEVGQFCFEELLFES